MESRRDSTTRGTREPRRTSQQSIAESTVKRSVHGERPVAVSPEAFPQSLYSVASTWPAKLRALAYALTHDLHAKASGELWQEGDLGGSKRCDVRIIRGISDGEGCQIGTTPCHLNLSMFVTPARPTTIECIAGRDSLAIFVRVYNAAFSAVLVALKRYFAWSHEQLHGRWV